MTQLQVTIEKAANCARYFQLTLEGIEMLRQDHR